MGLKDFYKNIETTSTKERALLKYTDREIMLMQQYIQNERETKHLLKVTANIDFKLLSNSCMLKYIDQNMFFDKMNCHKLSC